MKIKYKLILSTGLIVLIFFTIISFFSYGKSASLINEETSRAIVLALIQANRNIDFNLYNYEKIINIIYANREFQDLLSNKYDDEFALLNARKKIQEFIYSIGFTRSSVNEINYDSKIRLYPFTE